MTNKSRPPLSYHRMDFEKRLGFPAGRFLQPGPVLPLLMALLLAIAFFFTLLQFPQTWLTQSFTERGWVPYAIAGLAFWALMIVFVKHRKIALQRRALNHEVVPSDPGFVVSSDSAQTILDRLHRIADEPADFLLFHRIQFAIANLRNMGRVADVQEVLRARAEQEEAAAESSYTVVRGLVWAIPVLGFIGTVLGLSTAIGAFGAVLSDSKDMSQIKPALQSVTAGLATAFETTLQALIAALIIHLLMTMVKRSEEQMLDDFIDYCDRQIVNRLRLQHDTGMEQGHEPTKAG